MSILMLLLNTVLVFPTSAIRQEKEKRNRDKKGKVKLFQMILCILKISKLPELKNELSGITEYKLNIQKSIVLLYTSKMVGNKTEKKVPFTIASKTQMPRNTFNNAEVPYTKKGNNGESN